MLSSDLLPGFSFSALSSGGVSRFVVNICGHSSIEWPLARNMSPIDEKYLDEVGLDNLIIPISVSPPEKMAVGKEFDYSIQVVVHPCLTSRIKKSFRLCQHYVQKLTVLAIQWIQQECGVQLVERSCSLLGLQKKYAAAPASSIQPNAPLEEVMKAAAAAASAFVEKESKSGSTSAAVNGSNLENGGKDSSSASFVPSELLLRKEKGDEKETRKPLVQEVNQSKGIKKGFLTEGKRIYGEEGTQEGTGVPPDPLAHIPESLRQKCNIIDLREDAPSASPPVKKQEIPKQPTVEDAEAKKQVHELMKLRLEESFQEKKLKEKVQVTPPAASTQAAGWTYVRENVQEKMLTFTFAAPESIISMQNVDLNVTDRAIHLDGLVHPLPKQIDCDTVKAKFLKKKKELVIECMPV